MIETGGTDIAGQPHGGEGWTGTDPARPLPGVSRIPPPRSVLVIRMSGIGDVLWSTPLCATLRRAWPDAHIAYVARPAAAQVLENNPDVDEVLIFDREDVVGQMRFLSRLARRRFDLAIDIICSPATALQSWIGARHAIGFDFRVRRILYDRALSRFDANYGHAVEFNLYAAEALGLPVSYDLVWHTSEAERAAAAEGVRALGLGNAPIVALIPTGGFSSKMWPVSSYAALAHRLTGKHGLDVLVLWGTASEHEAAKRIAEACAPDGEGGTAEGAGRVAVCPEWSLRILAAALERCAVAVGNDTGPLHVATALDIPAVALLGPVNDLSQGPWSRRAVYVRAERSDVPCCGQPVCEQPVCMTGISVEQVESVLRDVLDGRPARRGMTRLEAVRRWRSGETRHAFAGGRQGGTQSPD